MSVRTTELGLFYMPLGTESSLNDEAAPRLTPVGACEGPFAIRNHTGSCRAGCSPISPSTLGDSVPRATDTR